jgi:hypothetical protein
MKTLSENQKTGLLLAAALIFGTWLRLLPASQAGFPLNDGGMFLTMIEDLRQGHYALPFYTSYNHLNIPFTYPPLPFYLTGCLADLFHLPLTGLLTWLPAIFTVAALPAFYLLAREMLGKPLTAALATLLYAFSPLAMDWFLMGGGLTRSLGQLGLILTVFFSFRLFTRHTRSTILPTVLCAALLVLSHPESALLAVSSVGCLWLCLPAKHKTTPNALLTGLGVSLAISPWLVLMLQRHGVQPFSLAAQTNGAQLLLWIQAFTFDFTQEPALNLIAVLGLIGLFAKISQRDFLLPLWVILPFFVNPRSAARAAILPLAMLAAISLLDVLLPTFAAIETNLKPRAPFKWKTGSLFSGYLLIYLLISGYFIAGKIAANHLSLADRQAMTWVRANLPADSQFIVLTGTTELMHEPVLEWFPTLTDRTSLTTLQGREWTWGGKFITSFPAYQALQNCLAGTQNCLEAQAQRLGLPTRLIYLSNQQSSRENTLAEALKYSDSYELLYEQGQVSIFQAK